MKFRCSLESKISLLVASLLFALLFAVGYTQMSRYRSSLMMEKVEEYQGLSGMLALACSPWNGEASSSQYQDFVTRLMKADSDISYIVISDSDGKVIAAHTRESHPSGKSGLVGNHLRKVLKLVRPKRHEGSEGTTVRVPAMVRPGERGTIAVGFVARSIDDTLHSLRTELLYTFALALFVGFIGSLLIAKAITQPMNELIRAAREVAMGDLDVSVAKTSSDEMGDLVDSFNGMVKAVKTSRDKLIERANTDSLTGLHNHRYFQERLRSELKRAHRYNRPLSMVMLDIDDFKALNDTYGHPAGDAVLQQVAEILVKGARQDIDVVCRYGGEEFAILFPETHAADATAVAERIREAVAEHHFRCDNGTEVSSTISLGVAEYPVHSSEREGLIMAADLALYQSKSMGKNRTTIFSNDSRVDKDRDPYRLFLLVNASDISTVEAMAVAVDAKGHRSPDSSKAVMDHAVAVARDLGMSEEEQRDVRIASLLRDIGKLGLAPTVLNKTEPLSTEEMEMIRSHPVLGYGVVQKSPHLRSMIPGILHHHERWDGTGYPKGLKGEEIPLIARIISVIDAYHAMVARRPHSSAMTPADARMEIGRGAGTQFDPRIVEVFVHILEQEEESGRKAA